MPELPEVETTRRGIEQTALGARLLDMPVRERRLRWPIDTALPNCILNCTLSACQRRGKYLLMEFDNAGTAIVHLGMSGSIRNCAPNSLWQTHDHLQWEFDNGSCLRYHDPRRFGSVLWHPKSAGPVLEHPRLVTLGVEPLSEQFTVEHLLAGVQGKSQSIKQTLLAGRIVVGVGNIYASESLFRAKIHPELPAGRLTRQQASRLVPAIVQTLNDALNSGGSTLRDYVNASGEAGAYFTLHASVYERDGQTCRVCGSKIKRIVQGQRATYFCPRCQRRSPRS
ncbi:bifunctional DNA-formamidopyrimidine glycosylase/DNA-(apurinic or apyrimidinic site) lyase [Orrella daihaiensis]|uniref:Formamidopyrimidine-DNA glycosylase n=1 Tax=Orrella daihaiensis TaxID=2782176 RepID=A0ABY4AKI4_9BURK|nr:bifunctional DNA-formamidopyrimidine glycosylase/DNA-(apurinic or apyrimidinic site) lyase [Orrella daihaiensis]UOD50777.1 bifunctional DNA-formamidopyrimidine glycosylase/DNA-(apurinic or apyrimidinic site) lyase [Orrella daihaiensis]